MGGFLSSCEPRQRLQWATETLTSNSWEHKHFRNSGDKMSPKLQLAMAWGMTLAQLQQVPALSLLILLSITPSGVSGKVSSSSMMASSILDCGTLLLALSRVNFQAGTCWITAAEAVEIMSGSNSKTMMELIKERENCISKERTGFGKKEI